MVDSAPMPETSPEKFAKSTSSSDQVYSAATASAGSGDGGDLAGMEITQSMIVDEQLSSEITELTAQEDKIIDTMPTMEVRRSRRHSFVADYGKNCSSLSD